MCTYLCTRAESSFLKPHFARELFAFALYQATKAWKMK